MKRPDVRILPCVDVKPASPETIARVTALARRLNARLRPAIDAILEEAKTSKDQEDLLRLLHQLFSANCGRFEGQLLARFMESQEAVRGLDQTFMIAQYLTMLAEARELSWEAAFESTVEKYAKELEDVAALLKYEVKRNGTP